MLDNDTNTNGEQLSWDKYKNKPTDEDLQAIYQRASATAKRVAGWYWRSSRTKRNTSLAVRAAIFTLAIAGALLPILAGLDGATDTRLQLTQYGVAALALAGLLQIADRVFGWSSGWLRYITTVTAMENLTRKFELDWAGYLLAKEIELSEADAKHLFDLAKQFEDDLLKLQSDETDKWVAEFNTGSALLGDLIKSQRESSEKQLEVVRATRQNVLAARNKANQNGAIELKLLHGATVKPVTITLDNAQSELFTGTCWSKTDLVPGHHLLSVTMTDGALQKTVQKVAQVPADGIVQVTAELA
jgi:hypothetical protein